MGNGPWEAFQGAREAAGPWEAFKPPKQEASVGDRIMGLPGYGTGYGEMNKETREQMATGVWQIAEGLKYAASPTPEGKTGSEGIVPLFKGVGNVAAGGLGYVASPGAAALRTFAGNPFEE